MECISFASILSASNHSVVLQNNTFFKLKFRPALFKAYFKIQIISKKVQDHHKAKDLK